MNNAIVFPVTAYRDHVGMDDGCDIIGNVNGAAGLPDGDTLAGFARDVIRYATA